MNRELSNEMVESLLEGIKQMVELSKEMMASGNSEEAAVLVKCAVECLSIIPKEKQFAASMFALLGDVANISHKLAER